MKKIILLIALVITASCSKKVEELLIPAPQESSQGVSEQKVVFSPDKVYSHNFSININQSAGSVRYKVLTTNSEIITIENVQTKITGCDPQRVKSVLAWIPDVQRPNYGATLKMGESFETVPNQEGMLVYSLTNLDGCSTLNVTVQMRLKPRANHIGQACQGSSNATDCQVVAYCREPYAENFIEVEVWKRESGALQLNKFINSGDGSRGLMSSAAAFKSQTVDTLIYQDSNSMMKLLYSLKDTTGTLKENVSGHTFNYDVKCEL